MYNSLRVGKINTRDQMNKTAAHNFPAAARKKDNVLALKWLSQRPREMFEGKTQAQIELWAQSRCNSPKEKFGRTAVLAVLHLDEKTPTSILISTEHTTVKNTKIKKANFIKTTSLNAKRWNPFLRKLHDDHGTLNEKWGLKRGEKEGQNGHIKPKKYYGELNALENELKSGLNQYKKDRELLAKAKYYMAKAKRGYG